MSYSKIKSYAKLNLALNIVGKTNSLHRIESIISFINLYDLIKIKKIKSKKHVIRFYGKFSKNIKKKNTISKLLEILEKKKILKNQKFQIIVNKYIPNKAGLGGGSMNAASILKFLMKKKIIRIKKKEMVKISNLIGSDVILGLNQKNAILNSKKEIRYFNNIKKFYPLIVKPNFGCSTKKIYKNVRNFSKSSLNNKFIENISLKKIKLLKNDLEKVAKSKYPKIEKLLNFMKNLKDNEFVRMTGSGSAVIAYFKTKNASLNATKVIKKKYKNYWCIISKTI